MQLLTTMQQKSYTSDLRGSPGSYLINSADMQADYPCGDLSWLDSIFESSSLPQLQPENMDLSNKAMPHVDPPQMPSATVPRSSSIGHSLSQAGTVQSCNCVQQLTGQLASLKALNCSRYILRPDFVLTAARDALSGWQSRMQCPSCQHSEDKDVLVLSVMALRALLSLIQKADLCHKHQSANDIPSSNGSSPTVFNNDQHSFLGTYQLACEEKQLVVDMLLQRTLKNLNLTIEHLKQKSARMAGTTPSRNSMSGRSSRSDSGLAMPSSTFSSYRNVNALEEMNLCGAMEDLHSADARSLDEHDSYLQGSLQNSTATVESLLSKTQAAEMMLGCNSESHFGLSQGV